MKDFINYLEGKNHSHTTQNAYLRNVNLFLDWYASSSSTQNQEPINCTKKDILNYLEFLKNKKQQENITRKNALIALNHYFSFLCKSEVFLQNPTALIKIRGTKKSKLYTVYTSEELETLYDNYYHYFIRAFDDKHLAPNQKLQSYLCRERNYIMLGMLIYQGLATNELQNIKLTDIDLQKAKVKIKGGKKSNGRTLDLKAVQIGYLINYMENIRPKFLNYGEESENLFFTLPKSSNQKTGATNLMHIFKPLTKQVKNIDKKLLNFKQMRASVITEWLKKEGLRKAQYYAGHRYISSTEKYLPNNLEGLVDDITKFNPF